MKFSLVCDWMLEREGDVSYAATQAAEFALSMPSGAQFFCVVIDSPDGVGYYLVMGYGPRKLTHDEAKGAIVWAKDKGYSLLAHAEFDISEPQIQKGQKHIQR